MARIIFIFSFLLSSNALFSQVDPDSLNRYDENHKKTGLWTVYLNEYGFKVDKEKSVYIGYELYDKGRCSYPFQTGSGSKIYRAEYDGEKGTLGNPVVLNGNFKLIILSNNKVAEEDVYKNGRPVLIKNYDYDKKDVCYSTEVFDFEKPYNNTDGTCFYQLWGRDNKLMEEGYFRDGEKGWDIYEK